MAAAAVYFVPAQRRASQWRGRARPCRTAEQNTTCPQSTAPGCARQREAAPALAHVVRNRTGAVYPQLPAHLRRHVHQIVLAPGGDKRQRSAADHLLRDRRVGLRGCADHVLHRPVRLPHRRVRPRWWVPMSWPRRWSAPRGRCPEREACLDTRLPCRDGAIGLSVGSRAAVTFPHTQRAGAARVPASRCRRLGPSNQLTTQPPPVHRSTRKRHTRCWLQSVANLPISAVAQ